MTNPVTTSPSIIERPAQPYVGTTRTVTMTSIGLIADRLPEILNTLLAQGQAPAGPPFLRYLAIRDDMTDTPTACSTLPRECWPGPASADWSGTRLPPATSCYSWDTALAFRLAD